MKQNRILLMLLVIAVSFTAIDTQAQIGKLNNLKDKVKKEGKKTIKSATDVASPKGDAGKMSEACLKNINGMKDREQKILAKLEENNPGSAKMNLQAYRNYLKKFKDAGCPGASAYEEKANELEAMIEVGNVKSDPFAYFKSGVHKNDVNIIDDAIANGLNLNQAYQEHERTFSKIMPINYAIENANAETVKHIIGKGIDVNTRLEGHLTALELSVKKNHTELVSFLLEKGAKPENTSKFEFFKTAAKNDNLDLINIMKKHPAIEFTEESSFICYANAPAGGKVKPHFEAEVKEILLSKIKDKANKEFANQIVFSGEPIPAIGANSSKFKKKFSATSPIFARAYLDCQYKDYNLLKGSTSRPPQFFDFIAKVEGNDEIFHLHRTGLSITDNDYDSTSYYVGVSRTDERINFFHLFNALKVGENKVTISCEKPAFKEEIVLVKKAGDVFKIGFAFKDVVERMKDPGLKAGILQAIKESAAQGGWKEQFTAVKINSSQWNILRNSLTGVIIGRELTAYCHAKWPDGHCTVQEFTFRQDYNGSSYSNKFYKSGTGTQEWLDCN